MPNSHFTKTYNKVVVAGDTLIDLSGDTVAAGSMLSGVTAHDKNGASVTGNIPSLSFPALPDSSAASGYTGAGSMTIATADRYLNIPSGYYGTASWYRLRGIVTSGIQAANIKDGAVISVGDTGLATRIANMTGTFTDASTVSSGQTAATADKILSGYSAWVDGVEVQGTATGGGASMVPYVIRTDASLFFSETYDKYIVADEGKTIPSYTSSATTLLQSQNNWKVISVPLNGNQCAAIVLLRLYAIPEYNTTTKGKARQDYYIGSYYYEVLRNTYPSLDGTKITATPALQIASTYIYRTIYWSSATAVNPTTSQYGAYINPTTPTVAVSESNVKITVARPALMIKGSGSYFSSTYWSALTDIRYVIKLEVYTAPYNSDWSKNGWMHMQILEGNVKEVLS